MKGIVELPEYGIGIPSDYDTAPFVAELLEASSKPSVLPPKRSIADSKESRVRVLEEKNKEVL